MAGRPISKGGTRGTVFRKVARQRLVDADVLLKQRRYNGAIYLAGYAIECQLKYAICQRKEVVYLPAHLEIHDWDKLLSAGGFTTQVNSIQGTRRLFSILAEHWGTELRYRAKEYTLTEAGRLYGEMLQFYQFINELEP